MPNGIDKNSFASRLAGGILPMSFRRLDGLIFRICCKE